MPHKSIGDQASSKYENETNILNLYGFKDSFI